MPTITNANVEFTRNLKVADYETAKFTAGLSAELEPNDTVEGTLAQLNYYVQNVVWTALGHPEKAPQNFDPPDEQTGAKAAVETRMTGAEEKAKGHETAEGGTEQPPAEASGAEEKAQDGAAAPDDEQLIELASRAAEKSGVAKVQAVAQEFNVARLQETEGNTRAQVAAKLEALT